MFCCSSRDDDGTKANQNATRGYATNTGIPSARVSARLVGVGIVFQQDSTGALHVKSLTPGGPAEKCGLVNMGDVLHWIDGHYVYRKPVALLAPLILGLEGTVVRLGLQRGTLEGLVYVRPPPSSSINARSRSVTHMHVYTQNIHT
jgi:C-terminal processing protease CtpA/Prc